MKECLKTNKICPTNNRKCKVCMLDDCKKTMEACEEMEDYEERKLERRIKEELPEQCKNCSFLEITDLRNKKVHCPYLVKEECLIGRNKE